jgi:hypothetical protein
MGLLLRALLPFKFSNRRWRAPSGIRRRVFGKAEVSQEPHFAEHAFSSLRIVFLDLGEAKVSERARDRL